MRLLYHYQNLILLIEAHGIVKFLSLMCFYMATITKRKEPPNTEKKQLLCINFKNLCFFFSLKKLCDHPKLSFRLNIIKFWTKFDNKHGCRLKLQLYSIYIYIYIIECEF